MRVKHNTSLLEEAVAHVVRQASIPAIEAEAAARLKHERAVAIRRFATGAAIALAAVGLGWGVFLATHPGLNSPHRVADVRQIPNEEKRNNDAFPPPEASLAVDSQPDTVGGGDVPSTKPNVAEVVQPEPIITTNYSKFSSTRIAMFGRDWPIEAGHHYVSETQTSWSYAWCYTTVVVDGVSIKVDLAERKSPASSPVGPLATEETLSGTRLTLNEAKQLALRCPWLDNRKFSEGDVSTPARNDVAKEQTPRARLEGDTLFYEGDIEAGFLERLKTYRFSSLAIRSDGGLLDEAMAAGRWLRSNGKTTIVDERCLSACVLVLAGGSLRLASQEDTIGVHRFFTDSSLDAGTAMEVAQVASSAIVKFIAEMGVDDELFHAMSQVPSEQIAFLDHARLRQWRLLSAAPEENIQAWFEGLDLESRMVVQSDLLLLGYYRGLIDGTFGAGTRDALAAYQVDVAIDPSLGMSQQELSKLHRDARQTFAELGFEVVRGSRSAAAAILPLSLLTVRTESTFGETLLSSDGGISVSLNRYNQELQRLYDAWVGVTDRVISYSTLSPARFVIAAKKGLTTYYFYYVAEGDETVGFTASWHQDQEDVASVAAYFAASNFESMSRQSAQNKIEATVSRYAS